MSVTLASLADTLRGQGLLARAEGLADAGGLAITGADCDSRMAAPGHLFVAKGVSFRAAYLASAVEKGAVAYLCGEELASQLAQTAPGVPALVATDVRRAMAVVSPLAWGNPDRDLQIVGLTGTKGKSTTAYMLRAILDGGRPGSGTGIMGSISTYDGIEDLESLNTTPEAPDLWRHVHNVRASGLERLVMEVSSQGLKYDRTLGLHLDVACFLNLGRDHISPVEHPDFEDYLASKLKIFSQADAAVVNRGTDRFEQVVDAARACKQLLVFSIAGPEEGVDVWARDVRPTEGGMAFVAHTPSWEGPVELPLLGDFNVENALCALCVCELLGIPREQAVRGLAQARVPGRMETLASTDGQIVGIVDFAHNKMAFSRLLPAVRAQYPGRKVVAVFGAVGSKALERRVELPQEAAKWADYLVFTEDDPGSEPVMDICLAMEASLPEGFPHEIVPDRAEAVRRAVELALESDEPTVVCLLCRGTEPTMHRGNRFEPMKLDAELFREALDACGVEA